MPDAYKTKLDIEGAGLPFQRLVEILDGLIANGSPAAVLRMAPQQPRSGVFYQVGNGSRPPLVHLWPTKTGGAVFDVSEQTLDSIHVGGDSLLAFARLTLGLRRLNSTMAPFYGACAAFRDAVLAAAPGAQVRLTQE